MACHSSILGWKVQGQRNVVGYHPWGSKGLDMPEQLIQREKSELGAPSATLCKRERENVAQMSQKKKKISSHLHIEFYIMPYCNIK